MKVRRITAADKEDYLSLLRTLDSETIYMAFEPEDRDRMANHLDSQLGHLTEARNSVILVAEKDGQLIGFLEIAQHGLIRTRHIASLFVGVKQSQAGRGVGSSLFSALEEWLLETELRRLELTVFIENTVAVSLYKKRGFEIEGTKRRAFLVGGKFHDECYMSRLI